MYSAEPHCRRGQGVRARGGGRGLTDLDFLKPVPDQSEANKENSPAFALPTNQKPPREPDPPPHPHPHPINRCREHAQAHGARDCGPAQPISGCC